MSLFLLERSWPGAGTDVMGIFSSVFNANGAIERYHAGLSEEERKEKWPTLSILEVQLDEYLGPSARR